MDTLKVQIPVNFANRVVFNEFIILLDLTNNKSLLGVDFLRNAGIVIDIPGERWYFSDSPDRAYATEEFPEAKLICTVTEITQQAVKLRNDEGEILSPEERTAINDLLPDYQDTFNLGGEPTTFIEHAIEMSDHRPISAPPRRLPRDKKECLR